MGVGTSLSILAIVLSLTNISLILSRIANELRRINDREEVGCEVEVTMMSLNKEGIWLKEPEKKQE